MNQRQWSTMQASAALPRWLAVDCADDWPAFDVPALPSPPPHLGSPEHSAIAAGLAAPDVCLIQGGSAESRTAIAAEIAGRAPGRTLLLAADPLALRPACARQCTTCTAAKAPKRTFFGWLAGLFGRSEKPASSCAHAPVTAEFDAIPEGKFDRVVIHDAHCLDQSTLESAASRGPRCILIGCLESHTPFEALWRRLTFEPWNREPDRLVCRLRRVPADRRGELETESVADRPDIELRILPFPQPELAEIAFPADMPREDAEAYVVQQLGEAPAPGTASGRTVTLPTHRRAEETIAAAQAVETLA